MKNRMVIFIGLSTFFCIILYLGQTPVNFIDYSSEEFLLKCTPNRIENNDLNAPILLDMALIPQIKAGNQIAYKNSIAFPGNEGNTINSTYYVKEFNHIKIFLSDGSLRIIPKINFVKLDSLLVPEDPKLFLECWKRSQVVPCLGMKMNRSETDRVIPQLEGVRQLAKLNSKLLALKTFPFLVCGTLLGWYRECDIIPHTTDLDIAIMTEEFNSDILSAFSTENFTCTGFSLMRTLGKPEDNYEMTVRSLTDRSIRVDIFLMYSKDDIMWIGATDAGKLIKFHYEYPKVKKFCSALLLGYHFWVNCDVETILQGEYGEWKKDWDSNTFTYKSSAKNTKIVGKFELEERSRVIQYFDY